MECCKADSPESLLLIAATFRLVRDDPNKPPIGIAACSVVTNVDGFMRDELRELDGRLNNPVQIRGEDIFAQLESLRQANLE
jgi:hypothetical protein